MTVLSAEDMQQSLAFIVMIAHAVPEEAYSLMVSAAHDTCVVCCRCRAT
jgi:hypothetical protein